MKQHLIFCLWIIALSACIRDADLELAPAPAQLVVNGHFSLDSIWNISVTNSIPTESSPLELTNVVDASVEIYEDAVLKGIAQYAPPFTIPGNDLEFRGFYIWQYRPEAGKEYELRVTASGYPTAIAKDRIPVLAGEISTLAYLRYNAGSETITLDVELTDTDPAASWYHLMFYIRRIDTPDDKRLMRFYEPEEQGLFSSDVNGFVTYWGNNLGLLLNDAIFENSRRRMLIDLDVLGLGLNTSSTFQVQAELRSVSPAYYNYYLSVLRQLELRDSPFSEPTRIFNNVQGGLGNFSGYQSTFSDWVNVR